jgi:drug/metabolite transporter (DMT)-like permease
MTVSSGDAEIRAMLIVFALGAALLYGSADFLGGAATRRAALFAVLLTAGIAGVVALLPAALLAGGPIRLAAIAWGLAAGAVGGFGLMSFYAGLAAGPMSVVSPVSALVATVLPVGVAVAQGERPGLAVWIGVILCLGATVLVSSGAPAPHETAGAAHETVSVAYETASARREPTSAARETTGAMHQPTSAALETARAAHETTSTAHGPTSATREPASAARGAGRSMPATSRRGAAWRVRGRGVAYGVASGAAFGLFFLFMRNGGSESGAFWPALAARCAGLAVYLVVAAVMRTAPVTWRAGRQLFFAALGAGALDAVANVCYVLATRHGLFGPAVVLTSLYPAVTVLLARVALRERMHRTQHAGLLLAAVGIALITG